MDLMYSLELRALARDAQSKDMQMCSPTWLIIETGLITSFAQIKMQIHIFSAFECAEIINFFTIQHVIFFPYQLQLMILVELLFFVIPIF